MLVGNGIFLARSYAKPGSGDKNGYPSTALISLELWLQRPKVEHHGRIVQILISGKDIINADRRIKRGLGDGEVEARGFVLPVSRTREFLGLLVVF